MKRPIKRYLYGVLAAMTLPFMTMAVIEEARADAQLEGNVSKQWAEPGAYPVGSFDVELVDTTRESKAHGSFKGDKARTLKSTLWYPAAPRAFEPLVPGTAPVAKEGGPFPLIIYNHGFMSFRQEGTYIARQLASHGYMVIAANFPLTNYFAPGNPTVEDVVNQPGDVSFLITQALAWNQDKTSQFFGAIDPDRIGVVGLSLGGMTTTLAAFHPTLKDTRIKAAVSIAGPFSMFDPKFFESGTLPFMMVAGSLDAIVPYKAHAALLPEKYSNGTLVTIEGATHVNFADIASLTSRWSNNPEPLGCSQLTKNLHREDKFLEPLGGPDIGIGPMTEDALPCQTKEFPRSLRPATQHDLTRLVVHAWFDSFFAKSESDRIKARSFLQTTLPSENPEIKVTGKSLL